MARPSDKAPASEAPAHAAQGTRGATKPRVLVVDDEPGLARALVRTLEPRGFAAASVDDGAEAIARVDRDEVDVLLVDLHIPRVSGMAVLEHVKRTRPEVEVVMMTAYGDVDTAVAAVKSGAYDFLTKPFTSLDAVVLTVSKAAERQRLLDRTRELERALESREGGGTLVGHGPRMREVLRLISGVAAFQSTVLLLGESGTGKELVARAIHERSQRAAKPLVTVNCGAIPADLVESELFGHVKGAFTGATSARQGLFEAADHGTIFLDEVGDLPLSAQVKLLRVLQEGEIRRVGASEPKAVDVRVIAATNVDLRARMRDGTFREDLFYRLDVLRIALPPLRERPEDIALLAGHFVDKYARRMGHAERKLSPEALRWLETQPWPGNVRELENAIERAFVLGRGPVLDVDAFDDSFYAARRAPGVSAPSSAEAPAPTAPLFAPAPASTTRPDASGRAMGPTAARASTTRANGTLSFEELAQLSYPEARRVALVEFERAYVQALLDRAKGNISLAARKAGLDRSNFKRVLKRVSATDGAAQDDELDDPTS